MTCLIERIGQFVNRQTKIECKVVANPEATVTWYHDATPLKQTWKYRIEVRSSNNLQVAYRYNLLTELVINDYMHIGL